VEKGEKIEVPCELTKLARRASAEGSTE